MVKKSITITDLTRMSGSRVCIAGVTDDLRTIRPEFENGWIDESWLFGPAGEVVVRPFARVIMDLVRNCPEPPHTEDWIVRRECKGPDGLLTNRERRRLLHTLLNPSVAEIFGAEIHHEQGYFIRESEGNRSLGTVRVHQIERVIHASYDGRLDYRIGFMDDAEEEYRLKVTDLAFRYFVDYLRVRQGLSFEGISRRLTDLFEERIVYLRIGLARPTWDLHPHCCYLQINGVYSFPDYLEGKCFADFARY